MFEYKPLYKNLYEVTFLPAREIENSVVSPELQSAKEFLNIYAKYHATSISIPEESLSLTRHPSTRLFQLSSNDLTGSFYTRGDILQITWRENANLDIRRFHEDWISCIYSKKYDMFISYPVSTNPQATPEDDPINYIYKNAIVNLLGETGSDVMYRLKLINMIPENIPNMDFRFSNTSEIMEFTMKYYIQNWIWEKRNAKDDTWEEIELSGDIKLPITIDKIY